jgi:carbonic anhydrase/acetyltransferase-like protein (isoleucine patch superfamily)
VADTSSSTQQPMIITVNGHTPKIDASAFIAPGATLIGDVEIGPEASIWFGCVLRGDINSIKIGRQSNLQDLCVAHVNHKDQGTVIGDRVSVGHRVIMHSCIVEDEVLLGMGSVIMDEVRVGKGAMVGAGAVVPPGMDIPPRHLVLGTPARVVKELTEDDLNKNRGVLKRYLRVVDCYADPSLQVDFSKVE